MLCVEGLLCHWLRESSLSHYYVVRSCTEQEHLLIPNKISSCAISTHSVLCMYHIWSELLIDECMQLRARSIMIMPYVYRDDVSYSFGSTKRNLVFTLISPRVFGEFVLIRIQVAG